MTAFSRGLIRRPTAARPPGGAGLGIGRANGGVAAGMALHFSMATE